MYAINCLDHRTDINIGHHGFSIDISPDFRDAVAVAGITQEMVDRKLQSLSPAWLSLAGYNQSLTSRMRVSWGAWGPEHIDVPGNACGLDIDRSGFGCVFRGGVVLQPHNVDCLAQKYLLLIAFTSFAYDVLVFTYDQRHATAPETKQETP